MLVLSRKVEEIIVINENIIVKVIGIKDDRVRLGIVAPKEVPIHREELYNKIKRDQSNASDNQTAPDQDSDKPQQDIQCPK